MRVTNGNLTSKGKDSIQISISWFFCIKIRTLPRTESFFSIFGYCRYSSSIFSKSTELICSWKISIENFTPLEETPLNKSSILIAASESWSPDFPESCYQNWFFSNIEMVFLRNYRFDFLHEGRNPSWGAIKLRGKYSIHISVSWFFTSKSASSQKLKLFFSTYVDIQSHVSL